MRRSRRLLLCAVFCALVVATACGGDAGPSPSPLPSLSPSAAAPGDALGDQAWGGLTGNEEIRFHPASGQDVVLRVVWAQWRASVSGEDGTAHERVLAVALRATCPEDAEGPLRLYKQGELRLSDERIRRSGRFPVAGGRRRAARRDAPRLAGLRERRLGRSARQRDAG